MATYQELTFEQRAVAEKQVLSPVVWKSRMRIRPSWFMTCLDDVLNNDLTNENLQLPAFPYASDLAVFSDYSGDRDVSPVLTYSFLIVDMGALSTFESAMKAIRIEHSLQDREISFKELNSTAMSAAVPKIMRAADQLPGLLFTLVVNKSYKTILGNDLARDVARTQLEAAGIQSWKKPREVEGVIRKVHTVAYWLSMLARDGMGVFWMTDNDNIVANESSIEDLQTLFAGSLSAAGAPSFRLIGLARQFPKIGGQSFYNDAVAVADLTAGSITAAYTDKLFPDAHSKKKIPAIADVLTLHAHQGVFLKKLTIAIDVGDTGQQQANTFWVEATTRSLEGYFAYEVCRNGGR